MTKIMVLSDGLDIAGGCTATESNPDTDSHIDLLTRPKRPQGEFVVTNNPGNVIPVEAWKPVAYKAQTPLGGVHLDDGLFKNTMENNISYLMNSFTFDQLARNFRVKAGPENIKKLLIPVQGLPLHFSIEGDNQFEYWPYFEVQEEPFSCFPELLK